MSQLVHRRRRAAPSPACAAGQPTQALQPIDLEVARQRLHHHPRPLGLRQVDAAAHRRRPRHADHRPRAARRPAGRRPGRRPRHGVPVLHAVSLAHRRARTSASACASRACRGRAAASVADALHRQRWACAASSTTIRSSSRAACSSAPRSRARSPTIPKILLLDEPFGALDNQTRALMQELLLGIWEADRKTVLFVTHDIDEAIFMANRVAVMTRAAGPHQDRASRSTCRIRATTRSRPRRSSPRSRRGSPRRSAWNR